VKVAGGGVRRCTADPMHSRVWFAQQRSSQQRQKHIMNSQRKSCLQIPSPLRRNSLVSQLRCTFANYIKALAYGTHEACFGIMFLLLRRARPHPSHNFTSAKTHARRARRETNLTWNWNALDYFAFIKLKAIKWFQCTHRDKSVCTDYSNREYI
jgi:hypothetical protein